MALSKRNSTAEPLTEHDIADRLDRAALRVWRIMLDVRQDAELFAAVKGSRYQTNVLNCLMDEMQAWGIEPQPPKTERIEPIA